MTISDIVKARGVSEILHFTTNKGILGILDAQSLKARARLHEDERLEYIFKLNAENRDRDSAWHDYVNLSLSRINSNFFSASGNWHKHEDLWWCVLSFLPEILDHPGVYFTTTNNMYSGVRRSTGEAGMESLFATTITKWTGNTISRRQDLPSHFTTCIQAEALYPGAVSTKYLQRIYVTNESAADELAGQISMLRHPEVPIIIRPEIFS